MGIVGSLFSGIFGGNSASKAATVESNASTHAADLQKQAADQSLAFQKQVYGDQQRNIAPWLNSGTSALSRLSFLMGLSPQSGVSSTNAPTNISQPTPGQPFNRLSFLGNPGSTNPLANDPSFGPLPPSVTGGGIRQPFQDGTADGGFSSTSAFVPRTGMSFDSNGLINAGINPGNPGAGTSGGFQNPDAHNFDAGNPAVTASTGGAITADGSPGMVPRTDGGGDPNNPTGPTPGGNFGSLANGFDEKFAAPTDVTEKNDPGYQFRLNQGTQALQNSAAARGGLLSGGTAKALNDYAQGSASNEYGNVYNRALTEYQQRYNIFNNNQSTLFNRLADLSGFGQTAAGQLNSAGTSAANNTGNILMNSAGQQGVDYQNAANATGSGYINQSNAYTNMFKNLGSGMSLLSLFGGN